MIKWAKFGSTVMKASKKASKKFAKTKAGKGLKKVDKAIGMGIYKGLEKASKAKTAIKSTGTYKDIRNVSRKFPLSTGQTAGYFTLGVGIGTLGSAAINKATGYETKVVKKKKNGKSN